MKFLLTLTVLTLSLSAFSKEEELRNLYREVQLKSDSIDSSIQENQAKYTFEFPGLDGTTDRMIYSIDGKDGKLKINMNTVEIVTTPGKHIFQFFYTENYTEAYSDSLEIQAQHHATYAVYMTRTDLRIEVDKPVIYLYPEKKIDVSVELDIKGDPSFFYPAYENGWTFQAAPSGELTFGENTYNYLFWEAQQYRSFTSAELTSGFNVKGKDVVSFLEEKLDLAGLNSKEKADFITYWGPRLAANKLNFLRFEFNETCNRYADLNIVPKPATVYRIYITWMPIEQELNVQEQAIESFKRIGFSVLEWGGSEITNFPDILLSEK
ncbi:MAG: hypothetical protein HWE22_14500 [Flavobacteriales bacterium]|nr:hypothetical protein [Flavobacteriales bacterium]